jgi:hypothetical protein
MVIPFTCTTFNDSRRGTDKWPVFVQVHCSIDVANMHKWQMVIKYTRLFSDTTSLQYNWYPELNSGTFLCFHLARFPVGQNIAVTWTTRTNAGAAPDFRRQVTGWFSEVRHFGFYSLPFKKGTGHYSQVGIKVSPRYHVHWSTHENSFDLGSDGAGGSRSVRYLRTVTNFFKLQYVGLKRSCVLWCTN